MCKHSYLLGEGSSCLAISPHGSATSALIFLHPQRAVFMPCALMAPGCLFLPSPMTIKILLFGPSSMDWEVQIQYTEILVGLRAIYADSPEHVWMHF